MSAVVSAMTFTACNKEVNIEDKQGDTTLHINVTAQANDLLGLDDTRTYIGELNGVANSIIWGENESMKIAVLGDGDPDKATYQTSTTSDYNGEGTAMFDFEITPAEGKEGDTYTYVGFYPASASVDNNSIVQHKIELNSVQNATASSYDPKTYILVAKHEDGKTVTSANWTATYRRATALNKLTLKGLAEDVVSVKITAPEGTNFAGRRYFNLLADEAGEVYNGARYIEVNYETPLTGTDVDGVNNKVIWFNSWDVELAEGQELTIEAKSATMSYTKTITARSTGIKFKEGYLNTLGVNMSGIEGEELAFDGCYAELLYSDVSADLTNSYGLVEETKTHGDIWKMWAMASNETIGLGNSLNTNNANAKKSYIKLPDFEENITSVVVYLKTVTAEKTLSLETTSTTTSGTIASVATTTDLVYTFDLSSANVKTGYLRSNGSQALVTKIEVCAGTDTRTMLDSPTNVVAALNTDNQNVTNSIDVSWDDVDDAGSYIITLLDEDSVETTFEASSSPFTATGLNYEMEYLVSVTAIPEDPYVNKNSAQVTATNTVTTGDEPGGAKWVLVSSVSDISAGDKYLLATNDKAHVYNGTVTNGHLQVVAVTPGNDQIADSELPSTAAQIEFVSAGGNNKYYLKVGDKYISATKASSGGFSNTATDAFAWTFSDATAGMNAVGVTVAAYIRSYNNNSFRSYGSTSSGATFYLYKLIGESSSGGDNPGGDTPTGDGIEITFSDVTGTGDSGNITVTAAIGEGSHAAAYTSNELRLYANNTLTVTSANSNIVRIELLFHKQGSKTYIETATANTGTYTTGGVSSSSTDTKTDVWTGSSKNIVITMGSPGQRVLEKVIVYYN